MSSPTSARPQEPDITTATAPAVRSNGHAPDSRRAAGSATTADLRAAVRAFAAAHVAPFALECDAAGTPPPGAVDAFWEQGFARRFFPDAPGTASRAYLADGCVVAEELAYGCAATASLLMLPVFFNRVVLGRLEEPLLSEFRARLADRPVLTSFAASEHEPGSDLLGVRTSARRDGDHYVLDGRKEYSSNLGHAEYVIVVARTGADGARATDALSWFLVPTDAPGVTIGPRWQTLGLRSMNLSPLELRGVRVPATHRVGEEGRGFQLMLENLSQSRTGIAAMAVGIARRARDEVLSYGSSRRLYGDKLIKLQDYRFRIADMEKDIAAARALVHTSAQAYDEGRDHGKEASIAKLYAGQMVMRVTEAASLMLGSVGYTGQSIVEKLFRDARHTAIVEGTEPIHKELIFASVLRRGGY